MPELPEVETVKNGLSRLINTKINEVVIRFPRLRYPLDKEQLAKASGQIIKNIHRRAKYLIFQLESGYLLFHLGMSGRITLLPQPAPKPIKHDHVDIDCTGFTLRYNDTRRFGCILYLSDLETSPLLKSLGPEPLENEFNGNYLYDKIKSRATPIKQLIMDNSIVVGVGNIYACESLFLSKILPTRKGRDLSQKECKELVINIRQILTNAIQAGGSSLRDYKNANGELGYFQQQHNVYGRAKQECRTCKSLILDIRLGQRNSFYCPSCQK